MKKIKLFIIPILLFALILSSCNLDADEGIFSKIASSQKDAGTKIKAYLGKKDSTHYVLTNSAVIAVDETTKNVKTIATSTSDKLIIDACLIDSSSNVSVYVLTSEFGSEDTNLYKYAINADSEIKAEKQTTSNVQHLLVNGTYVYYTEDQNKKISYALGFLNKGEQNQENQTLSGSLYTILENGEYVFVKYKNTSGSSTTYIYLVYKKDGTKKLEIKDITTNTEIRGFQPLSDTSYLLVDESGNIYSMISSTSNTGNEGSTVTITDTGKDLSSFPSGQVYSFNYTKDSTTYVVYKITNYFERLAITTAEESTTTYELETYNTTGYSTELRTSTVSNIVPSSENGKFVIATWTNSFWEIDTSDDSYKDLM